MQQMVKITPFKSNFSRWYTDVVKQGELISYGPVRGTIILRPNAYAIWENIQVAFNKVLAKKGVANVCFPLLIPKAQIEKEKEHIKGFQHELGEITQVDNTAISPLVIRPTSEVLFTDFMAKQNLSHNDLPVLYNQWVNVIRYEKKTNPFLRTSEFLWQEGHTAHVTALEARRFTRHMVKTYARFLARELAIPAIVGRKTRHEKFPGALTTYTVETMLKNGRALQTATAHYLGHNFSKPFNATFSTKDNEKQFLYQTSWGFSTRVIGAIIMVHGDNRGIVIPPKIARYQVDVLELFAHTNPKVPKAAKALVKKLSRRWRVHHNTSNKPFGYKASASEIQGIPLRVEVGPRDLERNVVRLVRRDTLSRKDVSLDQVVNTVAAELKQMHADLYKKALARLKGRLVYCDTYEKLKYQVQKGNFAIAPFAGTPKDEQKIKQETHATTRCIPLVYPLTRKPRNPQCIMTHKPTNRFVVFAVAY